MTGRRVASLLALIVLAPVGASAEPAPDLALIDASSRLGPLMVQGRVEGEDRMRRFVLDTGASASTVSREIAEAYGLAAGSPQTRRVRTLYGVFERREASRDIAIRLAGAPDIAFTLRPLIYAEADLDRAFPEGLRDGVLGADFLAGRPMTLEWIGGETVLRIGERAPEISRTGWTPTATIRINGVSMDCLVDTAHGSEEGPFISIISPHSEAAAAGEPAVLTAGARSSDLVIEEFLAEIALDDGEVRTALVQRERPKAGVDFDPSRFEGEPHCFIGPEFLESLRASFAPDGAVTLTWSADPDIQYNRSGLGGLTVDRERRAFRADAVTPGAPAYEAGLRDGDLILAVDGRALALETVGAFRTAMHGEAGDAVDIRYERGGEVYDTRIVLRDLLE